MYKVIFSKDANNDKKTLKAAKLEGKAKQLIDILSKDPFQNPPPYEKLVGKLSCIFSRRINIQYRLVYTVEENEKIVHILRMWTHYE